METYIKEVVKDYKVKGKTKIKEMENELMDLYILYKKDKKVIKEVMSGKFTEGRISHNIPSKDL